MEEARLFKAHGSEETESESGDASAESDEELSQELEDNNSIQVEDAEAASVSSSAIKRYRSAIKTLMTEVFP